MCSSCFLGCKGEHQEKPRPTISAIARVNSNNPCEVYSAISLVLADVFLEAGDHSTGKLQDSSRMREGLSAALELTTRVNDSELQADLIRLQDRVPFGVLDPSFESVQAYVGAKVDQSCR